MALGPGCALRDTGTGTTSPSVFPFPAGAADLPEGLRDVPWGHFWFSGRAEVTRSATCPRLPACRRGGSAGLSAGSAGLLDHTDSLEAHHFPSAKCQLSNCHQESEASVPAAQEGTSGSLLGAGQRHDKRGEGSGPHGRQWALHLQGWASGEGTT